MRRRVSYIPEENLSGYKTFVTEQSTMGLPVGTSREPETVLGPGSATTNAPRRVGESSTPNGSGGNADQVGGDIRALPSGQFAKPDSNTGIKDRPRTMGLPGEQYGSPSKDDYGYVTRRTMTGKSYKRRIPWRKQRKQRPPERAESKRYYRRNKARIRTRLKRWYKKVRRNRSFQTRKEKYVERPSKYKRKRANEGWSPEGHTFFLLPDFQPLTVEEVTSDGIVVFTLESDAEGADPWEIPVGSFMYLATPGDSDVEEAWEAYLDTLPDEAFDGMEPEDVREMASLVGYDLSGTDVEGMGEDALDALVDAIIGEAEATKEGAYHGLSPGTRRHKQRGGVRKHRHQSYVRNRARARVQSHKWYSRHKHHPQFVRRKNLRHHNPRKYKLRFGSELGPVPDLSFLVGDMLSLGYVVGAARDAEGLPLVRVHVPDTEGGVYDLEPVVFMNAVVFLDEDGTDTALTYLDECFGEEAYPDLTPEDVESVALLYGRDPAGELFEELLTEAIGVSSLESAGLDDLHRVCEAIIETAVHGSEAAHRVASRHLISGDIILYDQRPPDSSGETQDVPGRPYKDHGHGQITLTEKEPTHKPTPADFVIPSRAPADVGGGSGKVIPEHMKHGSHGDCDAKATSYAWVSPHGAVHRLGSGGDHLEWAFDYAREHRIPVDPMYEASAHDTLLKLGWVKITNYANIESWDFGKPATAWAAVAEVVAGCLRPDTVGEVVRVDTAPFGSEARKLPIEDFIERFGGRALSEKAFGKLNKTAASESLERAWFRVAKEFPSQEALDAHFKKHPGADKKKHWVKDEKPTTVKEPDEKARAAGKAIVESIARPKGWRTWDDAPPLTAKTRKKWETEHTARTPAGSVMLGTEHMEDGKHKRPIMKTVFREHVVKQAVEAARKALSADPPKTVTFFAEGNGYDDAEVLAAEGDEDEQHAVAKALHKEFGDKVLQRSWDDEPVGLWNKKADVWDRMTKAAGGDPIKARGAMAVFMMGQGNSYAQLKSEGWVNAKVAKVVKEATGIDIRKEITPEVKKQMFRMAFPGDFGEEPTQVSAIGDVFNAAREENLLKKIKEVEADGGVAICTPGAGHAYALKPVLEGGSKKSPKSNKTAAESLEHAWFKSAMTIGEIRSHTSPGVLAKGTKVKLSVKRADPARGIWTYTASGSEGAKYTVRVKALPPTSRGKPGNTTDVQKLDVLVSCSCPFFQYQGPEHWARANDFLYGKPRGTAATPTEKDPSGKNWVCKHAARALDMLGLARLDGPK